MPSPKRMTTKRMWIAGIAVLACLSLWLMLHQKNPNPKQVIIPFSHGPLGEIDAKRLTQEIGDAIGYPDARPILTQENWFWAVLFNDPEKPDKELGLHSLSASFILRVPGSKQDRLLSYELQVSEKEEMVLTYRQEIKFAGNPNEKRSLGTGHHLADLFDAIRNFPAESYRKLTTHGQERADLYEIRLNRSNLLGADNFVYNKKGPDQNRDGGIPFIMIHSRLGGWQDDPADANKRNGYMDFGGIGRANLLYNVEASS